MDKEKTLRLLIIEDSLNDAESIANLLRNAGYAIRPSSVEDEGELLELIQSQPLDMIICSTVSEEPSLQQAYAAVVNNGKDIPLLAVADQIDPGLQAEAMGLGARDVVAKDNPEHLKLVVSREVRDLEARRTTRNAEKSLRESERRCHALLDSSRDAITYVHEGMHIYANPVYLDMFGFSAHDEVEGVPIMDMVAPDDHGKFKEFLRQYSKGEEQTKELEVAALRGNGETFNALMEFSPASIEGEPCTQIVIRDQSMDQELEKKLKYLSKQDLLTGLYNRQYFIEEIDQFIGEANERGSTGAVLYIEPDNYKAIKESVGIAGSDLVLSDIANVLREEIGEAGVAARFGDHSFTVFTRDSDSDTAQAFAEKVRSAIENHISDVTGKAITTTCSIGISLVGETTPNAHEALSRADLACEMARNEGGNKIHLHNPIADEKAGKERDQHWVHLIREALDNDRFALAYQPIASLHGDTRETYEVLVRMRDNDDNEILPGQFIPVAEEHDLIKDIDRWVIQHAIETLTERRRSGHDTMLFIKLSGASISDETLPPWIREQLQASRLRGDSLVFEVSEANAAEYLKSAKSLATALQKLHCGFSLEHFGSGLNSAQVLKHLPVDYVKIDGSLMHNLADSQESQATVKSITEMAHSLGKTTIAEFVEDANSLAVLWQCGVNYIQGHFLQSPNSSMSYDFTGEES